MNGMFGKEGKGTQSTGKLYLPRQILGRDAAGEGLINYLKLLLLLLYWIITTVRMQYLPGKAT